MDVDLVVSCPIVGDPLDARRQLRDELLIKDADVFIQGYRPGSLAAQGFSAAELLEINPNLIIGNLSAWGPDGLWSNNCQPLTSVVDLEIFLVLVNRANAVVVAC